MIFLDYYIEPFRKGSAVVKVVHAIVCIIAILLLTEAALFLFGSERSMIRNGITEFAYRLGAADYMDYQIGMLLRLMGGLTVAAGAFTFAGLSTTLIMREPLVPASPMESLMDLRNTGYADANAPRVNFFATLRQARKYGFQFHYTGNPADRARWTRDMIESMFGKDDAEKIQSELEAYLDMMQIQNSVAKQNQ